MSDKKHIDRLFQEKLKDFEATPNDAVWNNINSQLNKDKDDRKVIPIWWKLAGVAAAIILLLTAGDLIFNDSNNTTNIVDTENNDENNKQEKEKNNAVVESENENLEKNTDEPLLNNNNEIIQPEISNKNNSLVNSDESNINNNQIKSNSDSNNYTSQKTSNPDNHLVNTQVNQATKTNRNSIEQPPNLINKTEVNISSLKQDVNKEILAKNTPNNQSLIEENKPEKAINNKEEQLVVEQEKIPLTEEVIVNNEDIDEKETINRWQVNPNIAPVYFNSFGKGSAIHKQLVNNEKSSEINMSYGVNISYTINDKLSVKSGINRVNLGYNTNDIIIYENVAGITGNTDLFRNIKLNENLPQLSFASKNSFSFSQSPSIILNESATLLKQEMSYYEIPLELKYKLSNKKLGFSLVGGFSTFILSDNKISYEFKGVNTELGEAANLNNISYSANIGFGLNYKIVKNVSFNIDPTFK